MTGSFQFQRLDSQVTGTKPHRDPFPACARAPGSSIGREGISLRLDPRHLGIQALELRNESGALAQAQAGISRRLGHSSISLVKHVTAEASLTFQKNANLR